SQRKRPRRPRNYICRGLIGTVPKVNGNGTFVFWGGRSYYISGYAKDLFSKLKMLFIFAPQLGMGAEKTYSSEEHQPIMTVKTALTILSALCFAVVSFGCGGGANTGNTNAKT